MIQELYFLSRRLYTGKLYQVGQNSEFVLVFIWRQVWLKEMCVSAKLNKSCDGWLTLCVNFTGCQDICLNLILRMSVDDISISFSSGVKQIALFHVDKALCNQLTIWRLSCPLVGGNFPTTDYFFPSLVLKCSTVNF